MKIRRFFHFLTLLLLSVLFVPSALAQQQTKDSLQSARQRSTDSLRQVQQHRTDSLAAIRKYKESKHYLDSVQRAKQFRLDSVRDARKEITDAVNARRKQSLDSAIASRKEITDANKARMKARTDSLAAIRKYRESKRYKDSVARLRNQKLDSIRSFRQHSIDSAKTSRKAILDSSIAARKKITDSSRAIIKRKSDSLATIRKYRESKRYRDSVQVTRQSRLDSIKAVRKIYADNILSQRKKMLDSMTKVRKARMDSMTKVRKAKADSMKVIRDARADSLAKKKEAREKQLKADQKKKEEQLKLKFELKIKKKHEAWSNEKMLKKKWSLFRRTFQNMFTRYNYYYNAHRKMDEAKLNMLRRKKDDFEKRIPLFPFDPNKDSTVFASDMDTIIRKASIGIQIHDPRTKWADDLYLLMGQAYYYKGNYDMAEKVFKYVIGMKNTNIYKNMKKKKTQTVRSDGSPLEKERKGILKFLKHKPVHNDAVLWLTRTYTDSKRISEAEAILDLLDASSITTEKMKGKIALERANLYIQQGATRAASEQLGKVARSKALDNITRQRASFLNGQLQMDMGVFDSAAKSFKRNIALHPAIDMDFYARKYMAAAVADGGGDQTASMTALKHLLKDGKYAPYYEQVYFILGKLAANSGNDAEAISNFTKSLQQPKTTKKQKAITFASIGNIQYRNGQYTQAQKSYDSASYFSKGAEDDPNVSLAIRRAKSLDKIKDPSTTLHTQDSLLKLSAMSEKEQKAAIKKYLKYLEKQKADSANMAANANTESSLATAGASGSSTGTGWYFSSPVAVQQGYNDFKRKWGNRPLADNWRRSAVLTGLSASGGSDTTEVEEEESPELSEAALFATIPRKESELALVRKKMLRAYLALAEAYVNDVEEYKEALKTLDTLDARYPNHEYPDQVLSLRYKAQLRLNNLEEAEKLRAELLEKYPASEFAKAFGSAADTGDTKAVQSDVASFYEETYNAVINREYASVISRSAKAQRSFGDPVYTRKFRVLEALAYAGAQQYTIADSLINKYIKEYPADSLRPWADAIVKNIKEQRAADSTGDSSKVTIPKALADSALAAAAKPETPKIPDTYVYKPKMKHYCIFLFGKPDAKTAGFRSGISDYSRMKEGKVLDATQQMLNADECMVVCKEFDNARAALAFLNMAKKEPLLFREIPAGTFKSFVISGENFLKLVADKSATEYLKFYGSKY